MKRRTLEQMQTAANEYAQNAFATTPLAIPAGHLETQAPLIMQALVTAWAAGYSARSEESSR